jgi:hypothetical protein
MAGVVDGVTFIVQVHGIGATATDNLTQAVNSSSRLQIGNSLVQVAAALVPGPAGVAANAIAMSMTGVVIRENKVTTVGDLLGLGGSVAGMLAPIAAAAGIPLLATGLTLTAAALAIGGLVYTINGIIDAKRAVSPAIGTTPDPQVKTVHYVDPLILDLDGDGLEIIPLSKGILFDANGDTIKTGTAWAGADDGMLVWDRNGNGSIDSGQELFGDETLLANGQKAAHGFAALSDLDKGSVINGVTVGSGDGVFDAQDAQYANLRIWRDLNQDGISQANELKSLADTGVTSIKLGSTATNTAYSDAILAQSSTFTRADGSLGQAGSFILAQNNFVRQFTPITVSDTANALPDLKGSGWVRDLREAATRSPELIALLNEAKDATTRTGYKNAVAGLLKEWGIDSDYNSASNQALSAGYGLILSDPADAQEAGWMAKAIKASEADRNAYRATLSAADLSKFDAMRERMGCIQFWRRQRARGYLGRCRRQQHLSVRQERRPRLDESPEGGKERASTLKGMSC